MKTSFIKIVAIALLLAGFMSCEKEKATTNSTVQLKSMEVDFTIIVNPLPIEDYFTNGEDPEDEAINYVLYEIAVAARPLFKDASLNSYIYSKATKNDNACVDLVELTNSAEARELVEDKEAFDNLKVIVESASLTHTSLNPGDEGRVEEYIPAIFVANIETADPEKQAIFSPGIDLNTEIPEVSEYEDYIVAWLIEENGTFEEILINEEMAMNTQHPIFIVDNAEEEITHRPKSEVEIHVPESKDQSNSWYSSYDYQLFYRWETSNYSEFAITAYLIKPAGVWLILERNSGATEHWKKIDDVHKNNIGNVLYHWEQICDMSVVPFTQNYIFWNTYEYDWNRSNKYLGTASRYNYTQPLVGKMKYSGDYYGFQPSQVSTSPLDLDYIYANWAKWYYGNGGNIRMWRIQP